MTEDSDVDLFDKMSALEFSFELLVANELADLPEKPRAKLRKRNGSTTSDPRFASSRKSRRKATKRATEAS